MLEAHKHKVKVRIITDDSQSKVKGADVYDLAAAGIQCTMDNKPWSSMHHKFAILDSTILLVGSFNWT